MVHSSLCKLGTITELTNGDRSGLIPSVPVSAGVNVISTATDKAAATIIDFIIFLLHVEPTFPR